MRGSSAPPSAPRVGPLPSSRPATRAHPREDWLDSGGADRNAEASDIRFVPVETPDVVSEERDRDGEEALVNTESEDEQGLHSTPEARLWLTVMLRAAAQLKDSTEWLSRSLECEATQLQGCERADRRGDAGQLAKQVQMHVLRVRDAEQFFFGRGSTFGEICELLGYNEAEYRSRVAALLGGLEDVLQKAEELVDASGIRRPTGRRRESRREPTDLAVSPRSQLASRADPELRKIS